MSCSKESFFFLFLTKQKISNAQKECSLFVLPDYFCVMTQRFLAQPVRFEQTESCRFPAEQVSMLMMVQTVSHSESGAEEPSSQRQRTDSCLQTRNKRVHLLRRAGFQIL